MSGSNRSERTEVISGDDTLAISALVIGFLAFCLLFAPILSKTKSHRSDSYYQECTNTRQNNSLVKVPPNSKASTEQTSEYQEYSFKICDLAAQQSMAESTDRIDTYTLFMTLFTLVGVFFLYFTMLYTRRTLEQARETNRAAWEAVNESREVGNAQTRAYLWFIDNKGRSFFKNRTGKLNYSVKVKNFGNTPAIVSKIETGLRVLRADEPTPVLESIFRDGKKGLSTIPPNGENLFLFQPISMNSIKNVASGLNKIYFAVRVEYKDFRGRLRVSQEAFELFLTPESARLSIDKFIEIETEELLITEYCDYR